MAFEDAKEFDLKRIQRELNIHKNSIENMPLEVSELEKFIRTFRLIL